MDKKRKLLLVDDDPSLLSTLGDFLRFEGYEVVCVSSGEEALVEMRASQPDLIILDMGMPGMGGVGFLDRITNPDGSTLVPVLVLTARTSMAEYFADKQIAGFLAKPCDPADLLMEVGHVLFMSSPDTVATSPNKKIRRVVVSEADPALLALIEQEFLKAGFEVVGVSTGLEAIEACIKYTPDALVLRLEQREMSSDEVIKMLHRLPHTSGLKAVVYGVELPGVDLQHLANLDVPQSCLLKDLSVNTIIDRVMAVT
jgi:DNA-binding response OmpR family regulator